MKAILLSLLLMASPVQANAIRWALGQIESGEDDWARGRAGEVSRYQIKPKVWACYSKSRAYHDEAEAWFVAQQIINSRRTVFKGLHGQDPTPFEIYTLWNAPAQGYRKEPSRAVRERAQRFANLVERYSQK